MKNYVQFELSVCVCVCVCSQWLAIGRVLRTFQLVAPDYSVSCCPEKPLLEWLGTGDVMLYEKSSRPRVKALNSNYSRSQLARCFHSASRSCREQFFVLKSDFLHKRLLPYAL